MGDENPIRTLGDYSKPSYEGYMNTIELPVENNVDFLKLVDSLDLDGENRERTRLRLFQFSLRDQASNWLERLLAGSISTWEDLTTQYLAYFFTPGRTTKLSNDILIRTIDQSAGGKLRDLYPKESWAILEDLALYDNESYNNPRDFAKLVKAITLPQDVLSTSNRRLIELENQVQRLMEAYLTSTQLTQVYKITTLCEIFNGPHDTHNYIENPEQAFVEYASLCTDEAGEGLVSKFMASQDAILSKFEADFKQQQVLSARSYLIMDPQCSTQIHSSINAITIHPKQPDESQVNEPEVEQEEDNPRDTNSNPHPQPDPLAFIATEQDLNEGEGATTEETVVEYFDTFPTRNELNYHRHLHIEKAYIDLNSPLNIMTRMMYNWIMRRKLDPREDANGGIRNFIGRIKGMHVFIGNFTYVVDFMIVEDISPIIDPRLSQVVLGRPFIEISNMTYDPPEGVVRFINETDEVTYKCPIR
ncbi:MAK10-like protein [Tanacetum coccineum]